MQRWRSRLAACQYLAYTMHCQLICIFFGVFSTAVYYVQYTRVREKMYKYLHITDVSYYHNILIGHGYTVEVVDSHLGNTSLILNDVKLNADSSLQIIW